MGGNLEGLDLSSARGRTRGEHKGKHYGGERIVSSGVSYE
jgi:hypothetical protein